MQTVGAGAGVAVTVTVGAGAGVAVTVTVGAGAGVSVVEGEPLRDKKAIGFSQLELYLPTVARSINFLHPVRTK